MNRWNYRMDRICDAVLVAAFTVVLLAFATWLVASIIGEIINIFNK